MRYVLVFRLSKRYSWDHVYSRVMCSVTGYCWPTFWGPRMALYSRVASDKTRSDRARYTSRTISDKM